MGGPPRDDSVRGGLGFMVLVGGLGLGFRFGIQVQGLGLGFKV